MKIVLIIFAVIILAAVVVMLIKPKKENTPMNPIALNQEFELAQGQSISIGTLSLTYTALSFPPPSYTGDKAPYIFAQIKAEEKNDHFGFALNEKHNSRKFHDYLIEFISRTNKTIKIKVSPSPRSVKISEEQAVDIAIQAALKTDFPSPEAAERQLKDNVWEIDIQSATKTDVYILIKINAETGEILSSEKGSRA